MSKLIKYNERPVSVEAIFWDGTLKGAGEVLREVPHSSVLFNIDGEPALMVENKRITGPAYVFLKNFRWDVAPAEAFTMHYSPAE